MSQVSQGCESVYGVDLTATIDVIVNAIDKRQRQACDILQDQKSIARVYPVVTVGIAEKVGTEARGLHR